MSACVAWAPECFPVGVCNAGGFLDADVAVGITVVSCNINLMCQNRFVAI
jgi:hypothetical protein